LGGLLRTVREQIGSAPKRWIVSLGAVAGGVAVFTGQGRAVGWRCREADGGGRNQLSRVEQTFGGTFRFLRSLREGIHARGLLLYPLSF
jgi:hypothetical protein